MKTLVHQPDKDGEAAWDTTATGKKDGKNESKGKKKDGKGDTDSSVVNEEPKAPVYQWTSITADGQVYQQNANQEYEKVNQLRLILETNPKTNEVSASRHRTGKKDFNGDAFYLSSKSFIVKTR